MYINAAKNHASIVFCSFFKDDDSEAAAVCTPGYPYTISSHTRDGRSMAESMYISHDLKSIKILIRGLRI